MHCNQTKWVLIAVLSLVELSETHAFKCRIQNREIAKFLNRAHVINIFLRIKKCIATKKKSCWKSSKLTFQQRTNVEVLKSRNTSLSTSGRKQYAQILKSTAHGTIKTFDSLVYWKR